MDYQGKFVAQPVIVGDGAAIMAGAWNGVTGLAEADLVRVKIEDRSIPKGKNFQRQEAVKAGHDLVENSPFHYGICESAWVGSKKGWLPVRRVNRYRKSRPG